MSEDHKPNNENEIKRIVAAGGWVQLNRVNGNLALSRALGDFIFKRNDSKKAEEQIVTGNQICTLLRKSKFLFNHLKAYPDVTILDLTPDYEFIVLACDGIWDVLTNEEVLDFVRMRVAQKMNPEIVFVAFSCKKFEIIRTVDCSFFILFKICEELITRCLAPNCDMGGLGCDNMTVILVCFLHDGGSYEKLAEKCQPSSASINSNTSNNFKPQINEKSDNDQSTGSLHSDLDKREEVVIGPS